MPESVDIQMNRWKDFQADRFNHEDVWQENLDICAPMRGDVSTVRSEGEERRFGIHDSTCMFASDVFNNFFVNMIAPQGADWLRVSPPQMLMDVRLVRDVMAVSELRVLRALASSNFYQVLPVSVKDGHVIGNGVLLGKHRQPMIQQDGSTFNGLAFEAPMMRRVWWALGEAGQVMYFVREVEFRAIEAARRFQNPGQHCMRMLSQKRHFEKCRYLHFVYPNEDEIPHGLRQMGMQRKPWASQWIAISETPEVVQQGGFDVNPYSSILWIRTAGENYARGIGHIVRVDGRTLNQMQEYKLTAIGQDVLPPLMIEEDTDVELDMGPRGLMVISPPERMEPRYLSTNANYSALENGMNEARTSVFRAYMTEVILGPDTQTRSATQAAQNMMKTLTSMGTVAANARVFLAQALANIVSIMAQNGALPELVALETRLGQPLTLEIDFTSPLFEAQRAAPVVRTFNYVAQKVELDNATDRRFPEILADIDWRAFSKEMRERSDVLPIFLSEDEIEDKARMRNRMAAEERIRENVAFAAENVPKLQEAQEVPVAS